MGDDHLLLKVSGCLALLIPISRGNRFGMVRLINPPPEESFGGPLLLNPPLEKSFGISRLIDPPPEVCSGALRLIDLTWPMTQRHNICVKSFHSTLLFVPVHR